MARIDPKLQLTEEQVDALMRVESRMRIATIGPGTDINLTPMSFGWAGGRIYTFGRGQKVANLRRDTTTTVLVDVGEQWRELKGVMMRGEAHVLETVEDELNDPHLAAAQADIGRKAGLDKPHEASASGRSRRWIVFTPRKITSWDNAKLP